MIIALYQIINNKKVKPENISILNKLSCDDCNAHCCREEGNELLRAYELNDEKGNCIHLCDNKCNIYQEKRPIECWVYPYEITINEGLLIVNASCNGKPTYTKPTGEELINYQELITKIINAQVYKIRNYLEKKAYKTIT